MSMKLGAKYRMVKHPNQPVGTLTTYDPMTMYGTIVWDDKNLIPPQDDYPATAFQNGTFEMVDEAFDYFLSMDSTNDGSCKWGHNWKPYTGLREQYEYCDRCDTKRFKK
jgi:hypothetical protein